jgi:methylmalonyl-CoA mutase C-terminal domain/subunit
MNRITRVLIAKIGLDGHDRGAKVVTHALRDAGFEVIYSGLHQTAGQIIRTAIQEDVDAIGISILSGAHLDQCSRLIAEAKLQNFTDVVFFGGGLIPADDTEELLRIGYSRIFTSGAQFADISNWLAQSIISKNNGTQLKKHL